MGDSTSSVEQCPLLDYSFTPEKFECKFDFIRISKTKTDHGFPLDINPSDDTFHTYQVVAGTSNNPSEIVASMDGLSIVNCVDHPNDVVAIDQRPPEVPIVNQNSENRFKVYAHLIKEIEYKIGFSTCSSQKIVRIDVYPDRVFKLEVSASITASFEKSSLSLGFDLSVEWDGKSKTGFINGSIGDGELMNDSTNLEWSLDYGGKWKSERTEAQAHFNSYKGIIDLFKSIYEGKLKFDKLIKVNLFSDKVNKGWEVSVKIAAKYAYENAWFEDVKTVLAGKKTEHSVGGTILDLSWSRDITSDIFKLFGWVGWLLDKVREGLEEADLASLKAVFKIGGTFSIKDLSFVQKKLTDGKSEENLVCPSPSLKTTIGFTMTITGKIRVDTKYYGVEAKLKEVGINCELIMGKKQKLEIEFTGVVLSASVFYETAKSATSTKAPAKKFQKNPKTEVGNMTKTIMKPLKFVNRYIN